MKRTPAIAITAGSLLYAVLASFSIISVQDPLVDEIYQEGWLESVTSLLAWFIPALVAGSLTQEKPIVVGGILGLFILAFDFSATVIIFGWEWAIALVSAFPASQLFLFMSAVAFTFAGWKIQQLTSQARPHNVA